MGVIMNYIKSVRPISSIFLGFMCLVGFLFTQIDLTLLQFLTIFTVVLVGFATMLKNDYDDRKHDAKNKNKTFALNNKYYLLVVRFTWLGVFVAILLNTLLSPSYGMLITFSALICFFYNSFYKIPFGSMIAVSTANLGALLFPLIHNIDHFDKLKYFLLLNFFIFLLREVIKDEDDKDFDKDYKWTIPSFFSCNTVSYIKLSFLFMIGLADFLLFYQTKNFYIASLMFYFLFVGIKIIKRHKKSKRYLDLFIFLTYFILGFCT